MTAYPGPFTLFEYPDVDPAPAIMAVSRRYVTHTDKGNES